MWKVQTVLQHLTPHIWLHEKQVTHEDKMNSVVTYNNIRLKCYINFLDIAPRVTVGSPMVAEAIDKFQTIIVDLKKEGVA